MFVPCTKEADLETLLDKSKPEDTKISLLQESEN